MRLTVDGDGVARAELKGRHDRAAAEENVRACVAIFGVGARRPILIDMRHVAAMDRGARGHYAGPATAEICTAAALLTGSPLSRAIGNFFLGLNRPIIPTRLFTVEDEALAWLREHRA